MSIEKNSELQPIERFSCPHCNGGFYVRILFIETDTDNFKTKLAKTSPICPHCRVEVDILQLPLDHDFHFSFQCEECGVENLQSSREPPKIVKCQCGQRFNSDLGKFLPFYWENFKDIVPYPWIRVRS
jgi:hypothetical protein